MIGNYFVEDEYIERVIKKFFEDCESECLDDEKCCVIVYVNGFCFIVYKDVFFILYGFVVLYYEKVCRYSMYLKMYFVIMYVNKLMCLKFWYS